MKKALLILFMGLVGNVFAQHPCTPPAISINGTSWKCKGTRDTLTVTGPVGTTYVWDNGKTTTAVVTGGMDADSSFYVVGTKGGCSDTAYFTVTLRLPPIVKINSAGNWCANDYTTLTASATGTNPPFTYIWNTGQTGTDITIAPGPDTTITYIVYVSNGCSAIGSIVLARSAPTLIACCGNNISPGDSVLLTAAGNSNDYQWQPSVRCLNPPLCDSVIAKPGVTTAYTVTATDSMGCQAEQILEITVSPAGVASILGANYVNVYPNPSSAEFTVDLQNKALVQVADITGRVLFSKMENPGTVTLGQELAPGIYLLFVDNRQAVKLVKL